MSTLDQKLEKLDERVDRIDITLGRVDERLIHLQETLDAHDAKSAAALNKATEAHVRMDGIGFELLGKVKTAAIWVSGVGGAIYFLWDKVFQ